MIELILGDVGNVLGNEKPRSEGVVGVGASIASKEVVLVGSLVTGPPEVGKFGSCAADSSVWI